MNNLKFVDDALIVTKQEELEQMVKDFTEISKTAELTMNKVKTNIKCTKATHSNSGHRNRMDKWGYVSWSNNMIWL